MRSTSSAVYNSMRRGPRGGRHRVRGVGAPECERRPGRRIEDVHVVGGAGDGADREAAANDLAEAGEVRRDAVEALRAAMAQPEGNHLVEDEQAAVGGACTRAAWTGTPGDGTVGPVRGANGSITTQASSPAWRSRIARARSVSL